jgi:hypothetical protein
MIAQVQLPDSAVLPAALSPAPVVRPSRDAFPGEDTPESVLHLLALELVRYSPLTAEKVAGAGRRKLRPW